MLTIFKRALPYIIILGIIGLVAINLGMEGLSLVETQEINGQTLYTFNIYNYFSNISLGFNNFKNNIKNLVDYSEVVSDSDTRKTIINILIAIVNTLLLPFNILANCLNMVCSLVGLPMNSSNFLYSIFNGLGSFQFPYLT